MLPSLKSHDPQLCLPVADTPIEVGLFQAVNFYKVPLTSQGSTCTVLKEEQLVLRMWEIRIEPYVYSMYDVRCPFCSLVKYWDYEN